MSLSSQTGQSTTEYAVILTLIAVAAVAAFAFLGVSVDGLYQRALDAIGSIA